MIFSKFIKLLGEPTNRKLLLQYISFCKNSCTNIGNKIEKHHIVPKSVCREWIKESFNIIPMEYENHIKAHRMLVEIYPIRKFYRPLNYMLNYNKPDEYSKMKSKEVIDWWVSFRKSDEYLLWIERRRKSTNNFENFIKGGIKSSIKRNKSKKYREKISEKCKDFWNVKNRKEHSKKIKEAMTNEVKNKMSIISEERWANKDFRNKMKNKMKDVNSQEEKRKISSEKNKKHWKSLEYRKKMKEARENGKQRDVVGQSNKMKEKWKNPEFRKMMLEKRRKSYEAKKNRGN